MDGYDFLVKLILLIDKIFELIVNYYVKNNDTRIFIQINKIILELVMYVGKLSI